MLKRKLKSVLLIDDSESDNFYHKRKIEKLGITENIKVTYGGQEALDYLNSTIDGAHPQPTLIFLDINMPGMTGWEFLEEYHKLEEIQKGEIILTMLSNSIDERDRLRAKKIETVAGYYSKPLDETYLEDVVKTYFEDYLI